MPGVAEAREQDRADAVHRRRRVHRMLAVILSRLPAHAVYARERHIAVPDEMAHVAR